MGESFRLRDYDWLRGSGRGSISGDFALDDGVVIRLSKLARSGTYERVAVLTERSDEL